VNRGFWAKKGGRFGCGILGSLDIGPKTGVGVLKTTKKRKKSYKMTRKRGKKERNEEKLKKKLQNDSVYCVFYVKIYRPLQNPYSLLKLAKFCGGRFGCKN